jgi:hypothetical protein
MDMTTVLGASIGTSTVFLFCCICCRYCNEYFKKNGCLYSRNEIGIDIQSDDPNGPHLHAKTVIDFSIGKRKIQVAPETLKKEDGKEDSKENKEGFGKEGENDAITGKDKHICIQVKESSDENPK